MAKVTKRQLSARFTNRSKAHELLSFVNAEIAKVAGPDLEGFHMETYICYDGNAASEPVETHNYFWDVWENSTPVKGQRALRIRIQTFMAGQEALNDLMQKARLKASELCIADSVVFRTWRTSTAPMQGSYTSKLHSNVITVYYRSHSK